METPFDLVGLRPPSNAKYIKDSTFILSTLYDWKDDTTIATFLEYRNGHRRRVSISFGVLSRGIKFTTCGKWKKDDGKRPSANLSLCNPDVFDELKSLSEEPFSLPETK